MKKLRLLGFLLIILFSCEKPADKDSNELVAKIVGYDQNCSTCILSFPYDSSKAIKLLGKSQNDNYHAVNLNMNNAELSLFMRVKVRKAENTELRACITLYQSFNYNNIYVLDYKQFRDFNFYDTIDLSYNDCINDFGSKTSFCFDSVLTDSRCPEDLICIWGGEAIARFKIAIGDSNPISLDLRTGTNDTMINGYKLSFIDLLPHPNSNTQRSNNDYKAKIVIKQK